MSRFIALLRQKIEEAQDVRSTQILEGRVDGYAAYREGVGYIAGLEDALKIIDEAESQLNKGEA